MIGRVEKMIIAGIAVVIFLLLGILFYLNSMEFSPVKSYGISVLVQDPSSQFIKGIEQAALNYSIDMHMVSGYEKNNGLQQLDYLQRELANGTDAIIIQPENTGTISDFMSLLRSCPPVITVGEKLSDTLPSLHIGGDNYHIGQTLGTLVAEQAREKECFIVKEKEEQPYLAQRQEGLIETLSKNNIPYRVVEIEPGTDDFSTVSNIPYSVVLAVTNENIMVPLCENTREGTAIFGAGYLANCRNYLENGKIKGLVVYNEYDLGYLCIEKAFQLIQNKEQYDVSLDLYTIYPDTMYSPDVVQILFPIG